MVRRLSLFAVPVIAVVAAAAWMFWVQDSAPGDPGDDEQVAFGAALYAQNCARCHGEDLSGELGWAEEEAGLTEEEIEAVAETLGDVAPAHDSGGKTSRHDDAMLFRIIDEGTEAALGSSGSRMEGFGDRLADDEIWAIVAFMKRFWQETEADGS